MFYFISLINVHYAWLNNHHHYHLCASKNSHRIAHVLTSSISKVPPSYRLQPSHQSVNDNNNESSENSSSKTTTSTGTVLHLNEYLSIS